MTFNSVFTRYHSEALHTQARDSVIPSDKIAAEYAAFIQAFELPPEQRAKLIAEWTKYHDITQYDGTGTDSEVKKINIKNDPLLKRVVEKTRDAYFDLFYAANHVENQSSIKDMLVDAMLELLKKPNNRADNLEKKFDSLKPAQKKKLFLQKWAADISASQMQLTSQTLENLQKENYGLARGEAKQLLGDSGEDKPGLSEFQAKLVMAAIINASLNVFEFGLNAKRPLVYRVFEPPKSQHTVAERGGR